ncbi:protein ALP1-like [Lactuca sativa]|uniref:protein ALP1-like n=1 Tax=Lactuca sativa TaxID=4236 RepID=UPI000CD8F07C|nr:protein ALP1-like [Lactuca sativa]
MLDSIDCTHWEWKNCPNAWRGQFTRGDHGVPTVILEAVVSNDLWFWHAFFGMARSNNDLNVLQASPIFNDILQGKAPEMSYVVNRNEYKYGYYLSDGIYPEYATFVKSYTFSADDKRKIFKLAQEFARKDVERAFGVLKQRWHIIKHPARTWDREKLRTVLTACVILHNMIIEEEGRAICLYTTNDILNPPAVIQVGSPASFSSVLEIQNRETHHNLRHDLTEYIWERQFQGKNDGEDDDDDDGDDEEHNDGGDEADDTGDDNDDD